MNAMNAAFLAVVILVCVVGCGVQDNSHTPTLQPEDLPDTWLSEMLRAVPVQTDTSHHRRYLWIANYEAGRIPLPDVFPDIISPVWANIGGSIGAPLGSFDHDWRQIKDLIGVDFRYRDQAVWVHGEFFGVHTGELGDPAQIRAKLADVGYDRYTHRGVEYYRFAPDYYSARDKHYYGAILYMLVNNIAFVDDGMFFTSRHTEDLERVVEAREGLARSVGDEERWSTLARAAGDEILGGLLMSPEYILRPFENEDWTVKGLRTGAEVLEDWSRYAEGPDAWGTLEPYTASAMGYTMRNGAHGTLIALYHPDPAAADRNAEELKHRWKMAHLDLRRQETGTLDSKSGEDIPFTQLCAPLETRTLVFEESSVLLATCPGIEQEAPWSIWGTGGYDFYWGLFYNHELHFLAPDLSGLAAGQ